MTSTTKVAAPVGGACKGEPTELWFPKNWVGMKMKELAEYRENINKAISICNTCPIIDKCLEYSLANEPFGIWGGKTEQERSDIRIRRGISLDRPEKVYTPLLGKPFFASAENIKKIHSREIVSQVSRNVESGNDK